MVPAGSAAVGVSVYDDAGDAVCVNVRGVPAGHSRLKALADAVTLSLKLMTIVELTATGGLILMAVGLKLLKIRDLRVANYLPALIVAPLLVGAVALWQQYVR